MEKTFVKIGERYYNKNHIAVVDFIEYGENAVGYACHLVIRLVSGEKMTESFSKVDDGRVALKLLIS